MVKARSFGSGFCLCTASTWTICISCDSVGCHEHVDVSFVCVSGGDDVLVSDVVWWLVSMTAAYVGQSVLVSTPCSRLNATWCALLECDEYADVLLVCVECRCHSVGRG